MPVALLAMLVTDDFAGEYQPVVNDESGRDTGVLLALPAKMTKNKNNTADLQRWTEVFGSVKTFDLRRTFDPKEATASAGFARRASSAALSKSTLGNLFGGSSTSSTTKQGGSPEPDGDVEMGEGQEQAELGAPSTDEVGGGGV